LKTCRHLKVFLGRVWLSLLPHVVGRSLGEVESTDGDLNWLEGRVAQIDPDRVELDFGTVGLTLFNLKCRKGAELLYTH
jgi:hypothetical protein